MKGPARWPGCGTRTGVLPLLVVVQLVGARRFENRLSPRSRTGILLLRRQGGGQEKGNDERGDDDPVSEGRDDISLSERGDDDSLSDASLLVGDGSGSSVSKARGAHYSTKVHLAFGGLGVEDQDQRFWPVAFSFSPYRNIFGLGSSRTSCRRRQYGDDPRFDLCLLARLFFARLYCAKDAPKLVSNQIRLIVRTALACGEIVISLT